MITLKRFRRIEAAVRAAGYDDTIAWSESIKSPVRSRTFASQAIYVICNSGMRVTVAEIIHDRCMKALRAGLSSATAFGHEGKTAAIDEIWLTRKKLFAAFRAADDKLAFCETLPWIGPVTKYHLAKNLGADVAKADVHLARLAKRDGLSAHELCARLAVLTGYREATVDTILWRACADGYFNSRHYLRHGWKGSLQSALEFS